MRKWIGVFLVLVWCGQAQASIRHMVGVGIPTTETPGGEYIVGRIDWGVDNSIGSADYVIGIGIPAYAGTFDLVASIISGQSAQLVYADGTNGLVLTATSADGPYELDAATFVDTAGYGGFELWTVTDTKADANRYGSITSMTHVPEPSSWLLLMIGVLTIGLRRYN